MSPLAVYRAINVSNEGDKYVYKVILRSGNINLRITNKINAILPRLKLKKGCEYGWYLTANCRNKSVCWEDDIPAVHSP